MYIQTDPQRTMCQELSKIQNRIEWFLDNKHQNNNRLWTAYYRIFDNDRLSSQQKIIRFNSLSRQYGLLPQYLPPHASFLI